MFEFLKILIRTGNFFSLVLNTAHSSPLGVSYGVSFVRSTSDLCSTSVTAVLCHCMQYRIILNCIITVPNCTFYSSWTMYICKLLIWFSRFQNSQLFYSICFLQQYFPCFPLGEECDVKYWDSDSVFILTGRKLRVSPLYTRMEKYATFGQTMGYERPLYFRGNKDESSSSGYSESYRPSVYRDSTLCMLHIACWVIPILIMWSFLGWCEILERRNWNFNSFHVVGRIKA